MSKVAFTAGRLADFQCSSGRPQAFLWDATAPGLGLRVTARGARAFVFQGRFDGETVRITIGSPKAWSIKQAQERAREIQSTIDAGRDPRQVKAERVAADVVARAAARKQSVTVAEAWKAYCTDRSAHWGERHAADHERMARAGGEVPKRGVKDAKAKNARTVAGPLYPLMALRLADLTSEVLRQWAERESSRRGPDGEVRGATQARLAMRLLSGFLAWCAERPEYAGAVPGGANPARSKRVTEVVGPANAKRDALLREQLKVWFREVLAIANPVQRAYLVALLMLGARPGEVLALKWTDIDESRRSVTLRDKAARGRRSEDRVREVPLPAYVASLVRVLPRRNAWVFSSPASESGCMSPPDDVHRAACARAGIAPVSLHGLRRSFKSLTEWMEIPSGVVAQLQGHRPSATVERHYAIRPLDLLALHQSRIEAWMLEQAGIVFDPKQAATGRLQVVAA